MRTDLLIADSRRGAAAVELAVVTPVLLILVLGIIESGQAISVRQSMLDAARGACRLATLENVTNQQALDQIDAAMSTARISQFSATVSPTPLTSANKGDLVSVQISANFNDVSWLPIPNYFAGLTLTGACSLPHE